MKHISIESVTPNLNSSFLCAQLENSYFNRPLHVHPEYELILLEKGGGMIFVGDMTAPLQEGMFMLLGPNLPHLHYTRFVTAIRTRRTLQRERKRTYCRTILQTTRDGQFPTANRPIHHFT